MLLNDVFERFVQDSPVSVMVRGLLENTLSPRFLDELFANAAELQYTRTLLFSSVVDLMDLVVNRIQPAVNSAYHARAKTIGVSLKSVYNKLDNLETGISAAMVGTTAERLEMVVTTIGGALPHCCRAIASRFLTEIISLPRSTASRSCARSAPGPCRVRRWSCSIRA